MDRRELGRLAVRVGLGRKFVSKDVFLTALLKQLEDLLVPETVLKGGTAISRAGYLDAPRFSEDIDIDVCGAPGWEWISKRYHPLLEGLDGFDVQGPRRHSRFIRFDALFENHYGEKDRIRIELARGPKELPEEDQAPRTVLQSRFTRGDAALLRTYSRERLFAGKVMALAGRRDGKDAFDLRGMWRAGVDGEALNVALVEVCAEAGRDPARVLEGAAETLGRMLSDVRSTMNATNPYVPRWSRPDWGALLEDVSGILGRLAVGSED